MFKDAVNAKDRKLRVLKANPADGVRGPERGEAKAKQYLYPSEFLRLVSCGAIPLRYRVAYALAVYTYTRAGELVALTWDDVDLQHRVFHVTKALDHASGETKGTETKVSRKVPIEQNLLPLLALLRDAAGGDKATGPVVWLLTTRTAPSCSVSTSRPRK
jgi:integrase